MSNNDAKWLNRYPILHEDHGNDLSTHAAMLEFGDKLPRGESEKRAYMNYRRANIVDSAAHHLIGMRAAQGTGDSAAAKRHGTMYALAVRSLGHDHLYTPPDEVLERIKTNPVSLYRFKSHPADRFLASSEESIQKAEKELEDQGFYGEIPEVYPLQKDEKDYSHFLKTEVQDAGYSIKVVKDEQGPVAMLVSTDNEGFDTLVASLLVENEEAVLDTTSEIEEEFVNSLKKALNCYIDLENKADSVDLTDRIKIMLRSIDVIKRSMEVTEE